MWLGLMTGLLLRSRGRRNRLPHNHNHRRRQHHLKHLLLRLGQWLRFRRRLRFLRRLLHRLALERRRGLAWSR